MADRYDPKGPPRQAPERRPPDARRSMEDDPLAELAKMVQGRAPSATRGRTAPAKDQGKPGGKSDTYSDLEAELLNDLQASFAAVREAAAAISGKPADQPPDPAPASLMGRTPPPDFPSLADAFAPLQTRQTIAPEEEAQVSAESEPEPEPPPAPRLVPIPPAPVMQPAPLHKSEAAPPPERVARIVRPSAPESRPEAAIPMRPTAVTPNAAPPPRQSHSRWEQPELPKQQTPPSSRFAPPKVAPPPQQQPALNDFDEDADPFSDSLFTEAAAELEGDGAFPLDSFGPGRGDDLDDDMAPHGRPRRSRAMMIVLPLLAVVVIVGGGYFWLNGGSGQTTGDNVPVITADDSPTKITPDTTTATTADSADQNKQIYDRINSSSDGATDTTLVTPNDGAVADVPSETDDDNPITRVIIPGGPGFDAPTGGDQQADAATADGGDSAADTTDATDAEADTIGPRKVRTVVVKPDGTIVSSAATDAPAAGDTATAPPSTDTATAPDTAAPTATVTPPPVKTPPKNVNDDTVAITGNDANGELTITPSPDTAKATAPPAATTTVEAPPAATKPPATKPPVKTVTTTAVTNDRPIDLTGGAPSASAVTSSGVLVQVSSQKSEEAARATYKELQARYPKILGSFDVNVQRADLGDRGVFFRARVGPFSASDAQRLCDDLKSAGGDCILAKR